MSTFCLLLILFASVLCSSTTGPYLQIIEWDGIPTQECPNLGNAGDGSPVSFSSALAYQIRNSSLPVSKCVTYNSGYGVNQFNTSITPKNGFSLAITYTNTSASIAEYNSSACAAGTFTGVNITVNFLNCYQTTENGVAVSRWFQVTGELPPGYNTNAGPPNFYTLTYYTTSTSGGCGITLNTIQLANNQLCHQLSDTLWVNGYCNSTSHFAGNYYNSSDCSGQANPMGPNGEANVDQCYTDFAPGLSTGCLQGVCLNVPATKVIIQCSTATTVIFNFAAFALLALVTLIL